MNDPKRYRFWYVLWKYNVLLQDLCDLVEERCTVYDLWPRFNGPMRQSSISDLSPRAVLDYNFIQNSNGHPHSLCSRLAASAIVELRKVGEFRNDFVAVAIRQKLTYSRAVPSVGG